MRFNGMKTPLALRLFLTFRQCIKIESKQGQIITRLGSRIEIPQCSCTREMADQDQQKLLDRLLNAGGITPSLEIEKVFPQYRYSENGKRIEQCSEPFRVRGAADMQVPESENIAIRTSRNQPTEDPA